ncbi:unnamed protein product [Durusdinium trenchii]|uniref:Uncharacterized protein n=1 Tax=Durusdinium trenchii TaxID=1381693 RepID=A0ABP0J4W9_9DINO
MWRVWCPWVFLLSASAAQVDPGLSKRCVRRAHGLNLTQFQVLSTKHFQQGEQMGILNAPLHPDLLELAKVIWLRREVLLDGTGCPAAVVIAAVMFMLHDIKFAFASRNNLEHEGLFHRLSRLQKEMLLGMGLSHQTDGSWPFSEAARAYTEIVQWLNERVAASRPQWDPEPVDTSDEAHTQALEDVSVILEEEGLDWFPYSGTLIALLRHGLRSGHLDAVRDVVDHDVDVLVGVTSAEAWQTVRWNILHKLEQRGWDNCFSRTSVDAPSGDPKAALAREDLLLCTRTNPRISLDMGSYILGDRSIYVQRYCVGDVMGQDWGCYIPRLGTLRTRGGRLPRAAIYPLQRCKCGSFSVPCPARPLEVLKATMPGWNFSEHCLPLPDIAQRRARRDGSEADQADEEDSWVAEGLTAEDVQVLRDRAVELEKAGYMSMLPYFSTCDATSVEKKVGYPGYCQDGCDRFSG